MRYRSALIGIMVALMGLTGCKHLRTMSSACHDTKPYMRSASIAPLKIPPGLDTPDTANALHIPALNTPAPPPRKKTDPCLDEPPAFNAPKQAPPQA
jgi:uncharacterized lipoprotein